jgi:spermidine/putrescine transport system substrate-binding protein
MIGEGTSAKRDRMKARMGRWLLLGCLVMGLLSACGDAEAPKDAAQPALAKELVFYDWADDLPQSILDDFTREYGVKVDYRTYASAEEALASLRAGQTYDLVVIESRLIPTLVQADLLAALEHGNLPNFRNIAANFRDLSYDPGNRHSVPFNWGTTGLVVRRDLVAEPVTRWADLWDPRYAGRVGLWLEMHRDVIALTLKSLGYSANSEDPSELEAALDRLRALRPHALKLEDFNPAESSGVMSSGQAVLAMGFAKDVLEGRKRNAAVTYVMPSEGALFWGDNFVIPTSSANKYTAEVFIDFLLRPDVTARITNENNYATPNEAARPLIDPAIRDDPVIFPTDQDVRNAELLLPLSPEGEKRYADLWARLMTDSPRGER